MNDKRFMYEIRPLKPIKDLIPGKLLSRPCSMQLTKDEVLLCMKYGPVYRKIDGRTPVKVTGDNLDELHKDPNAGKVTNISEIAQAAKDFQNVSKAQFDPYTGFWKFVDKDNNEVEGIYDNYKDQMTVINTEDHKSDHIIVRSLKGKRIPLEIVNSQKPESLDKIMSRINEEDKKEEDRDFLDENGEESGVTTYDVTSNTLLDNDESSLEENLMPLDLPDPQRH